MLKRLVHKVRSQRGASMSMALMLFLVVTVVASVALTAATATSGRYSQLADMDRSYYNVTSAAKLFWDELGGSNGSASSNATVTITRSCDATLTADGTWTPDDTTWAASIDGEAIDLTSDTPNVTATDFSLFQIVSAQLVFGADSTSESNVQYSCKINEAKVKETIDFGEANDTGSDPLPNDISAPNVSYKAFLVKPVTDGAYGIQDVNVGLSLKDDQIAEFKFVEADAAPAATPFRCKLTASFGVEDSPLSLTDKGKDAVGNDKYQLEWETVVSWRAESLETGGGSYGQAA